MDWYLILKLVSLTVAIWYVTVVAGKFARGHAVPLNILLVMSASITAFVYAMGWLS